MCICREVILDRLLSSLFDVEGGWKIGFTGRECDDINPFVMEFLARAESARV